ncbi:MAG TPA: SDR family oxidoreductase [Rhodocyclaceae bacterium]|nr:SDR family oxidoreductase [Rhodocyclaceae bacterium]
MQRLLIIGCGDVARRALPRLLRRYRIYALVRKSDPALRAMGVTQIVGDLDRPASLKRIAGLADVLLHSAPPADGDSADDTRTRHLLSALKAGSLPRRIVYISTSGVYGDCGGVEVDETRSANPESQRAQRRIAAETALREFGLQTRVVVSILRVPGIYAADRLPLERIKRGDPILHDAEDSYSNHIHADDLAEAVVLALTRGRANRTYNASDDSRMKMGDWFTALAESFDLPVPRRVHRNEAEQTLSPTTLSFMRESRQLNNERIKRELGLRLAYPTVQEGLASAKQTPATVVAEPTPAKTPKPLKPKTTKPQGSQSKNTSAKNLKPKTTAKKSVKKRKKKPRREEIQLPLFFDLAPSP